MEVREITKEELKELYSKDFPLWVERNLELLREGAYELVDWENLLEEIEDMGLRHLESCISYLAVILEHLYKLDHFREVVGDESAGKSSIRSIKNSRKDILTLFDIYPSLRAKLPLELDKAWRFAIRRLEKWLERNDLEPESFSIPRTCPYTYEEAMERVLGKVR